jgi:hypothetical protein
MATLVRPPKAPIVLDQVVDDPDAIRQMARDNGPYWQPWPHDRLLESGRRCCRQRRR